ncbi:MAG: PAS domain S-box-containing protein [Mariniblastus sp.]|jgi:PAS domain S-box-containing protein
MGTFYKATMMNHKQQPAVGPLGLDANLLFERRYQQECHRVNKFMMWLMFAQWVVGIGFAMFFSPFTWIGQAYEIHVHVWAAILLGGAISGFAIMWTKRFPNAAHSRHVIAICQILWSALLIHLSGGRIETHFHVFSSLAILSIYRDWKILLTATAVVAIDHFSRGVFFPLSAFGVINASPFRWMEHAAWVLFEVSFLAPGCYVLRNEIRELCAKQTEIAAAKRSVDRKVNDRTEELQSSTEKLLQKTAEAEKLALVAQYTDNAVVITDEIGRIEWVNDGFTRVTGYEASQVIGKRTSEFLQGPKSSRETAEFMRSAVRAQQGYDVEIVNYRKNGETYWVAIGARPICDFDGKVVRFIAIESDITERVNKEIERKKLNEQLVVASRLAGMAEVSTGVLHDVGNVLNSINVSATLIRNQFKKSALSNLAKISGLIMEHESNFSDFVRDDHRGQKIPAYIAKVSDALKSERDGINSEFQDLDRNVEHIKQIISVQQYMAKSTGLRQEVSPRELIADALKANKGILHDYDIEITLNIEGFIPKLISDRHRILQILVNLIKNAKDVLVDHQTPHPRIEICVSSRRGDVEFEVIDNGIGIPGDKISKIFQSGFTTKKTGHGFGLHSSANAATELGGTLTASSAGVGQGAIFRLRLPANFESPVPEIHNVSGAGDSHGIVISELASGSDLDLI